MSFHRYFFAIYISLWGSTHDSADCWSTHRSSAARDSFKRVHDWCKAGWRRPGAPPPPNKNPGYAGGGPSSEAQQNKIINHIQEPWTYRGHHQFVICIFNFPGGPMIVTRHCLNRSLHVGIFNYFTFCIHYCYCMLYADKIKLFWFWFCLRGCRLFKGEKKFWRDKFWDFYGKRQDFHKISMWLGVYSKWLVQQQRKHACPGSV